MPARKQIPKQGLHIGLLKNGNWCLYSDGNPILEARNPDTIRKAKEAREERQDETNQED